MLRDIPTAWARLFALLLAFLFVGNRPAHADVGLVLEGPSGPAGFFSDTGHASVWISRGCLGPSGEIRFCEGSGGIVLTSTSYWPNPGVAAIPADLFFLGAGRADKGHERATWTATLASTYPNVDPAFGKKYLGRTWRRSTRILTFQTTPEQDRAVLATIESERQSFHYSILHRNCAFYAEGVIRLYLGDTLHVRHWLDGGLTTPRALERALFRTLDHDPTSSFHTVTFPHSRLQSWRQPPRNFCESALFDPKYAVPLVLFQPEIYLGFGACYAWNRIPAALHDHETSTPQRSTSGEKLDRRVAAFESLTGTLPQSTFRSTTLPSNLQIADPPPPSTARNAPTLPSTPAPSETQTATPAFR